MYRAVSECMEQRQALVSLVANFLRPDFRAKLATLVSCENKLATLVLSESGSAKVSSAMPMITTVSRRLSVSLLRRSAG